jgi:hypothetical protein
MKKLCALFALVPLIWLSLAACGNGSTEETIPDLAGAISISPNDGVSTGTGLTASYSGSEAVAYQWNKGGSAVSGASGTSFMPFTSGSYTVTVSADGYNSKTSAAVEVSAASGSLSGTIAIAAPDGAVEAGMKLTAVYAPAAGEEALAFSFQWKINGAVAGANSEEYTPYAGGSCTVTVGAPGYEGKTSAAVTVSGQTGAIDDPIRITVGSSINLEYSSGVPGEEDLRKLIAEATAGTPGFINLDLSGAAAGDIWNWDTLYNRDEGRFSSRELDKTKIVHLTLPDSVTKTGGKNTVWRFTFSGKDYPNMKTLLARNVTLVGEASFQFTAAEFIDLPQATVFEDYCFYDYQKGFTVNMPKVLQIGNQAFQHLQHDDPRDDVGSTEPITLIMGPTAPLLGGDMFKDNRGSVIHIKIPFGATLYTPIAVFDGNPRAYGGDNPQPTLGTWVYRFRASGSGANVPGRIVTFERSN